MHSTNLASNRAQRRPAYLELPAKVGDLGRVLERYPEKARDVMRKAAREGHIQAFDRAYFANLQHSQRDLKNALAAAYKRNGLTVNDDSTVVGRTYKDLYGRDFDKTGFTIQIMTPEGVKTGRFAYNELENETDENKFGDEIPVFSEELKLANYCLLRDKGLSPPYPRFNNGFDPVGIEGVKLNVGRLTRFRPKSISAEHPVGNISVAVNGEGMVLSYFGNDGVYERAVLGETPKTESGRYDGEGVHIVGSETPNISAMKEEFEYLKNFLID